MPRVSQEHLDARRRQILEAARACFIRNGFHATTMQDVFVEAGLSAGAVYRYFSGKTELITAIAQSKIGDLTSTLDEIDEAAPPPVDEVLGQLLTRLQEVNERDEIAKLVGQVWGEAIRTPEVAETMRANIGGVLQKFAVLARRYQELGVFRPDVPPEKIARVLAAFLQGFMLQLSVFGDVTAADFQLGLRGLVAEYVAS